MTLVKVAGWRRLKTLCCSIIWGLRSAVDWTSSRRWVCGRYGHRILMILYCYYSDASYARLDQAHLRKRTREGGRTWCALSTFQRFASGTSRLWSRSCCGWSLRSASPGWANTLSLSLYNIRVPTSLVKARGWTAYTVIMVVLFFHSYHTVNMKLKQFSADAPV